jgi:hypothetical protein
VPALRVNWGNLATSVPSCVKRFAEDGHEEVLFIGRVAVGAPDNQIPLLHKVTFVSIIETNVTNVTRREL